VGSIYFGSSGSGIWRESDQKLFGNCSWVSSPYAGCDYLSTFGGYGRFSTYYGSIASLLAAGSDDRLEENDSCSGAAPLSSGTFNDLVVKSVDEDWYEVTLADGGELSANLYFTDAHGNINLELYDSCGGSVVASATSYTNNEYLNYTNAGPAGDFYLRAYLFDDTRNTYDMTCMITGVKRPDPWEFDEYGGSCQQDSDCWGPSETVAYCVPDDGGTFPGTCYAPANRYLSIARDPEQADNTARRITLQGGGAGPWWVGSPTYNAVEDTYFASVSATSVYAGIDSGNWVSGDWPHEIHVKGCEIAPGQTYEVQAIPYGADESDEGSYSEALDLKTAPVWGDVVSTCAFDQCLPPEGTVSQPAIDDVLAVVNAFTGTRNAPLPWLDIDPVTADGEPEGLWALIGDVLATVNAYTGEPYPGNGPLGCP
jgi:hypothetical protein